MITPPPGMSPGGSRAHATGPIGFEGTRRTAINVLGSPWYASSVRRSQPEPQPQPRRHEAAAARIPIDDEHRDASQNVRRSRRPGRTLCLRVEE